MNDLTKSAIDRQNILNNTEAIDVIQKKIGLIGLLYEDEYLFTSKMVAEFYGVTTRTLSNILKNHEEEIRHNGYQLIEGQRLKEFKDLFGSLLSSVDDSSQGETHFPLSKKGTDNQSFKRLKSLALFNFRAFLNIAMLLTESEKAKMLRSKILDIAIDIINKKTGGSTKYINLNDKDVILALAHEPIYRKEFTNALNLYLEMGNYKYELYTDLIYKVIFKENANEYKVLLKLEKEDNPRDTMYAEVLKLIASFEIGIADEMQEKAKELGRPLRPSELDLLIDQFASKRLWIPQIENARTKMASRDYGLRNVIHTRLEKYIGALNKDDYDRFLGDKSKSLIERIIEKPELLEVFKRLNDR